MRIAACAPVAAMAVVWLLPGAPARAQASRERAGLLAAPGTTLTTALRVANTSARPLLLRPAIRVPAGWSVPMGTAPFTLAPAERDSWIVSVAIPSSAAVGRYLVGVSASDSAGAPVMRDSIVVDVTARHGLELSVRDRPGYAISARAWHAAFVLTNRGNEPVSVALRVTTGLGSAVHLRPARMTLRAGESGPVDADITTVLDGAQARDEVLELSATETGDSPGAASSSVRVTVVQDASVPPPVHRVPARLRLRAADASAGVSPYEVIGGGALRDGGSEQLSFVIRGPAGRMSQFGDQDEYSAELRGARYDLRAGDASYHLSSLTDDGQPGFGAALDLHGDVLSAGAFTQRSRFQPAAPVQRGAYVRARGAALAGSPQLTLGGRSRQDFEHADDVLTAGAVIQPTPGMVLDLEMARSSGPRGRGTARMARVTGGNRVRYDLGTTGADDAYAGVLRGSSVEYGSVSIRAADQLQVTASTAAHHEAGGAFGFGVPWRERSATLLVDYASRYSLQYASVSRQGGLGGEEGEWQRGALARAEQRIGVGRVWGAMGAGMTQSAAEGRRPYHEVTVGASAGTGSNTLSVYGETSDGMWLTRGSVARITVGADARMRLRSQTSAAMNIVAMRTPGGTDGYSQVDASISQALSTGSVVGLHLRLMSIAGDSRSRRMAFVEYSMPLALPLGPMRSPGRVTGRIVDEATGQGIGGALVRLGPQAAVTDQEGRVAFAGVPAGAHRLVLDQQLTQEAAIFTGNATVLVDGSRRTPTTFSLAMQRPASVEGTVRQMVVARTGLAGAADSLADGAPLDGVSLALVSASDTLYASSDASGAYRFADVASGAHVLRVLSEATAGAAWQSDAFRLEVSRGESRRQDVRMVPRHRPVQLLGDEGTATRGTVALESMRRRVSPR